MARLINPQPWYAVYAIRASDLTKYQVAAESVDLHAGALFSSCVCVRAHAWMTKAVLME